MAKRLHFRCECCDIIDEVEDALSSAEARIKALEEGLRSARLHLWGAYVEHRNNERPEQAAKLLEWAEDARALLEGK